MQNDVALEHQDGQWRRAVPKVAACLLLVFAFTATATATVPPLQAASPTATPSRTPTRIRTSTPTLTPTRALTPRTSSLLSASQLVPGQTQVDPNTLALYHFDYPLGNIALDATGNYTGTLYGNAVISTTGLYAGVLGLDGNGSYVRTGYLGAMPQGTVEAFVDFSTACPNGSVGWPFTIISAGGELGSNQPVMSLRNNGLLDFQILTPNGWVVASSGINPCRYLTGTDQTVNFGLWGLPVLWPYETLRFHHVAGTWGPRGVEIWVDGVLHGVGNMYYSPPGNYPNLDYACNPQYQEASIYYPVACQTPVMAPPYPQGDYTGGLLPYSTFLIGCDAAATCLNGRIDEVRISNIQRQFQWTVVPTVTPTPTQTPVQITGAYAVTNNTLGLYHLESTWGGWVYNEASMAYDGYLRGYAALVPGGRYGSGAYLSGVPDVYGNRPWIDMQYLPNASAGTLEAWIKLDSLSGFDTILCSTVDTNVSFTTVRLGADWDGYLKFGALAADGWHSASSGVPISSLIGSWHHVAGTWGPRGLEIWIDGVLRASDPYTGHPDYITRYRAGWDGNSNIPSYMIGTIDEIRVSNVQRTYSPVVLSMPIPTPTVTPTCTPTLTPPLTPSVLSLTPSAYQFFLPLVRAYSPLMIC